MVETHAASSGRRQSIWRQGDAGRVGIFSRETLLDRRCRGHSPVGRSLRHHYSPAGQRARPQREFWTTVFCCCHIAYGCLLDALVSPPTGDGNELERGHGRNADDRGQRRRHLPGSAQNTSMHATGLRLRRTEYTARNNAVSHIAFPPSQPGRHPRRRFRSSIPSLHFHLSTLDLTVTGFGP